MSKNRPQFDSNQRTIFEVLQTLSQPQQPTTEGQLCCADRLRAAMRAAMKGCPLSVYQIAGEMSHLLGTTITADQIYSWTREDQRSEIGDQRSGEDKYVRRHIPAEYLPAFCKVTSSNEPIRVMGELAGSFVLPGPDAMRADIQKMSEDIRRLQKHKRNMEGFLKELEREPKKF